MERLVRSLGSVKGLGTVPGLIALGLWSLAIVTLWIDGNFPEFAKTKPFEAFHADYDTAQTFLSTVAAAAITTLGLVYSIVLVVFTTAAGNIGPRLLQRFTGDNVNQFTAGLFGGTFLFALTVLHQTDATFIPAFSIAVTFLLAGLSTLQLIYFVHTASRSVTIDEEVAEIADQLESEIERLLAQEDAERFDGELPEVSDEDQAIPVDGTGYIAAINSEKLVELCRKHDVFLSLLHEQGAFVIKGQRLAVLNRELSESDREEIETTLFEVVELSSSRSPNTDVEFAVNLLIEIALRALSPGINDTYTAVACIDRLSSALAKAVKRGLRDQIRTDEDDTPRLRVPGLTINDLINASFHPLRRASKGNVLMSKHILQALGRLSQIAEGGAREVLNEHADLVIQGAKNADLQKADLDFLEGRRKALMDS
ncbi:DUF2254 domain-containing protein [Pseudahrensia aquimaris]|uniref:DUF2254 domain-containing protein n=1 Tax=Pseudahrensia aquimaris TaxID=744461 RepID=A0ABW3FG93_9HYPH